MNMVRVRVACADTDIERLVAELSALGADGFHEAEACLDAYFPPDAYGALPGNWMALLSGWGGMLEGEPEEIADRNWNAEWEASIEPIHVAPFYIRPSWHIVPIPEAAIDLVIDPKMSFGTGYHETTRLMLRALAHLVEPGDRVLDAGTGTGILGIAALKVGASSCFAFDFDPWCAVNAVENAELNGVGDTFTVVEGDERVVPGGIFDVVLANINREALLAMTPALLTCLRPGGVLGLSGLLISDQEMVRAALPTASIYEDTDGEWWTIWIRNETRDH